MKVSRERVLHYRVHAQQLGRGGVHRVGNVAILDLGVQNTGPDGAGWALINRGVDPAMVDDLSLTDLVLAWTLRGAPHFYRYKEVAAVAAATAPFSEADAAKPIFDAAKPLRATGISPLDALDVVADEMRTIVGTPADKGQASTSLTARLSPPYLRYCRVCKATHSFEQLCSGSPR